jgi:hypothetical protein
LQESALYSHFFDPDPDFELDYDRKKFAIMASIGKMPGT